MMSMIMRNYCYNTCERHRNTILELTAYADFKQRLEDLIAAKDSENYVYQAALCTESLIKGSNALTAPLQEEIVVAKQKLIQQASNLTPH